MTIQDHQCLLVEPKISTQELQLTVLRLPPPFFLSTRPKQMRRIATRYDKTALSFMSFLNLAAARLWIRSFVNVT